MNPILDKLCKALTLHFDNKDLLKEALTHRSFGPRHNERLEFLGDSILNCIIAEALYHQYPRATEGELSCLRASFVREETLARIAQKIDLGRFLILGQGELKTGGAHRTSILADSLEAVIAAVFLDQGFDASRQFILNLWKALLQESSLVEQRLKDPKTHLQERLQALKLALPTYQLESATGELHEQIFTVSCCVASLPLKTGGTAATRRKAEQLAASAYLTKLEAWIAQNPKRSKR